MSRLPSWLQPGSRNRYDSLCFQGARQISDSIPIHAEKVYEAFNNQGCPLLKGKPKFFIIQSCRGDKTNEGTPLDSPKLQRQSRSRPIGSDSVSDAVPISPREVAGANHRPAWEDMVIAYSTIPGFASMRNHDMGSWFIQAIVEVFMEYANQHELIDLLRITSDYLSLFGEEIDSKLAKQTCNVEMRHLYKKVYFKPCKQRRASL